ncbi:hypothetical protein E7T09_12735 [Deinococcus sp. KSM4-11]|uniref:hypothetical protein n=1 Tax=Deinococcus sp. KSM4-11 TaxID=2568654 RepID=UPI0010A4C358|nr:hypothetical protein [Deinococcus sp. KSM4-11]THF86095.1 hypothetical protein E7T09_12735 [Deinococcus sp. KSM4-11]
MPRPRPDVPHALHLTRLAQGTPGEWVRLPGGNVRVLNLSGKAPQAGLDGWVVCLSGEAVIDLPLNNFVRLRPGEGHRVTASEPWVPFDTREGTVILLVVDGE